MNIKFSPPKVVNVTQKLCLMYGFLKFRSIFITVKDDINV